MRYGRFLIVVVILLVLGCFPLLAGGQSEGADGKITLE